MPLNIDWQQILLHLFNFVILTGGLYFLLYKPVKDFMAKREAHYAEREAEAEAKLREMDEKMKSYDEKLAHADEEIRAKRAEADAAIERETKARLDDAQAQAKEIVEKANKTAKAQKIRAFAEGNREIRTLAMDAVEKLALDGSDALDAFLDAAESEKNDD